MSLREVSGMHEGHREKMRVRIESAGLDSLAEHEVLETLLYFAIPRGDTNPIAHRLMDTFGSLAAVLEAPEEELLKVEGIGPRSARLLSMLPHYARRYLLSKSTEDRPLCGSEEVGRYMSRFFVGQRQEKVFVLCLDMRCRPICCRCVHEGSVNAVEVHVRKVVSVALANNASAVVLAHNHPNGVAIPSGDDILTTGKIAAALSAVGIELVDHIVIAGGDEEHLLGDFVSFADSGYLHAPPQEPEWRAAQSYWVGK